MGPPWTRLRSAARARPRTITSRVLYLSPFRGVQPLRAGATAAGDRLGFPAPLAAIRRRRRTATRRNFHIETRRSRSDSPAAAAARNTGTKFRNSRDQSIRRVSTVTDDDDPRGVREPRDRITQDPDTIRASAGRGRARPAQKNIRPPFLRRRNRIGGGGVSISGFSPLSARPRDPSGAPNAPRGTGPTPRRRPGRGRALRARVD